MADLTLEDDNSRPDRGLERSRRERVESWVLTGPPGRAWSFAADLASAVPMLVRHWAGRRRRP